MVTAQVDLEFDVRIVAETDAHEGPVYIAGEHALYFTSLPDPGPLVAVRRLDLETNEVTTVVEDANGANGMTLHPDGSLIMCEQGTPTSDARISRLDLRTGERDTVVDRLRGLRLNSPNDVVATSDGEIWFTDPSYGFLQGFKPEPQLGDHVYRYADGRLTVVADSFDKPNGLAFSPDESVLYVGDSGANQEAGSFYPSRPHHIKAFDVVDGRLRNERLFAVTTPGFPDGIKVDGAGRVYASAFSGVQIFDPSGDQVGEVDLPGAVNFTFGRDESVLYVTTDTAVQAVVAKGARA
jgi:gluconolactonase